MHTYVYALIVLFFNFIVWLQEIATDAIVQFIHLQILQWGVKKVPEVNLQRFLLIPVVSELCPEQISRCKNKQWEITPKLDKSELRFLCTATQWNLSITTFLVSELCSGQDVNRRTDETATNRETDQRKNTAVKIVRIRKWF